MHRPWLHPTDDDFDWRVMFVLGVCVYEFSAITTGRLPTLTKISHDIRDRPVARFALWIIIGWLINHLWGEGREISSCSCHD